VTSSAQAELIGREVESELIDELVDRLHDAGGALIVRGEAGIGKSALLERARERARARGGRVLSTVGVESEAELAFAGLHQLLHPVIGLTEHLSESQRQAIDAAFGVSGELEPDPFRVALAAFQPFSSVRGRFMRWSALLDLVEAAVGSGQAERLLQMIAELEDTAARSGSPFFEAELLCARPLLAGHDEAEKLLSAALHGQLKPYP
jgi:hypothetical protein